MIQAMSAKGYGEHGISLLQNIAKSCSSPHLCILVEFDSCVQVICFAASLKIHEQTHSAENPYEYITVEILLFLLVH